MHRSTISAARPAGPIWPACGTTPSTRDCFDHDDVDGVLSKRRPGERRDPYAVSSRFCTGAEAFCHTKRQGLWVPAFAGTTINKGIPDMSSSHGPLRIGIGGPVGSGKTALMDLLCKTMRDRYDIAAITNDIYTKWDAEFLVRSGSLTADRIAGVETGGCPHTAIREDASMNMAAGGDMRGEFSGLDMILIQSCGDKIV